MICTNCCKDDDLTQDFSGLPSHAIVKLCSEWLCDECMDERDRAAAVVHGEKGSMCECDKAASGRNPQLACRSGEER